METSFFKGLLNDQVIRAAFITLIQSLWMGAVMALLAGIIIMLTKKSGPHIRYRCLTGLLLLFIICTGYVFYHSLETGASLSAAGDFSMVESRTAIISETGHLQQRSLIQLCISFLQNHADIVVLAWFAVICFKCIKLISGLRTLYFFKTRENLEVTACWNNRLKELAAGLGISKPVTLLQSYLAKVPMVIGHMKPVILFPVGVLNALPQNEVEAILLHELAHIKRNDFLINLLQQLAEMLFFFNPGVLWISSLMKNERENCCDDIAIAVTHDKKIFINALVAFQEYNNALPCAATFNASKTHLLNRVKRIITNNNQTLNNMEKIILSSGIVMLCIATLAFSPFQAREKKVIPKTGAERPSQAITAGNAITEEAYYQNPGDDAGIINYVQDTTPVKAKSADTNHTYTFKGIIDGQKIQLTESNNKIIELYVDGKKIPEESYATYKPLIEKLHQQMKEQASKLKAQKVMLQQNKEALQKQSELLKEQAEEMKIQSKIMQEDLTQQKELMEKEQFELQKQNDTLMKIQSKKMQAELLKEQEKFKQKQVEFQKKAEELKLQQQKLKEMIRDSVNVKVVTSVKPVINTKITMASSNDIAAPAVASIKTATIIKTATNITSVQPEVMTEPAISVKPVITVNPSTEDIILELEESNIIISRNNLSFRLTNDELIVNGVKQPAALHQKIVNKYVKKPSNTFSLSYSNRE